MNTLMKIISENADRLLILALAIITIIGFTVHTNVQKSVCDTNIDWITFHNEMLSRQNELIVEMAEKLDIQYSVKTNKFGHKIFIGPKTSASK